jgi:hypothetical protein
MRAHGAEGDRRGVGEVREGRRDGRRAEAGKQQKDEKEDGDGDDEEEEGQEEEGDGVQFPTIINVEFPFAYHTSTKSSEELFSKSKFRSGCYVFHRRERSPTIG